MPIPVYSAPAPKPANNNSVIIAVCCMAFLLATFVVLISLVKPGEDNLDLIAIVFAAITPTTVALLAYMKGAENSQAVKDVHLAINGRLTQLLAMTETASHAEGVAEGVHAGVVTAKELVSVTATELRHAQETPPAEVGVEVK